MRCKAPRKSPLRVGEKSLTKTRKHIGVPDITMERDENVPHMRRLPLMRENSLAVTNTRLSPAAVDSISSRRPLNTFADAVMRFDWF